jgi:hypothetical protein
MCFACVYDPMHAGPPLAKMWTVEMGAGSVKAFGGFDLGAFAPRVGKKSTCVADDGAHTLIESSSLANSTAAFAFIDTHRMC